MDCHAKKHEAPEDGLLLPFHGGFATRASVYPGRHRNTSLMAVPPEGTESKTQARVAVKAAGGSVSSVSS